MSQDSQTIDSLLGDHLVGCEHFFGLTNSENDLFGVAEIRTARFEKRCLLKTKISLHRTVNSWNKVTASI